MKKILLSTAMVLLFGSISNLCLANPPVKHKTLAIGSKAPDFHLLGVDGKYYSLASFKKAKILMIVFTCDHCPTAQAYEGRIIAIARDYKPKGVEVVAIMPNDPKSVQLNELGYTDLGDSYAEMKIRAREKHFNFPYLFDGKYEKAANAYGPVATPHVFIFDQHRVLRYEGRVDDVEKPTGTPRNRDTRNALDALLAGKEVPVKTTKVFGCSIKWIEKESHTAQADSEWATHPVTLDTINAASIQSLIKSDSDKLLLINVWATWCGPCVNEFPSLVVINRMYRLRDFQFISISADNPEKRSKVLAFLKSVHAANTNYLFNTDDKYQLINAVDVNWGGALPYTILVEPGGKIVYEKEGPIDPSELKTKIVDDKMIGRYY
ncbi:MAG: redoxin family protein [Bacteroidota bacterium]|nr:redoxin family protein [Bacteroidota bacterium]